MKIESVLKIKLPLAHSKRTVVHIMYSGDYILNKINSILKPFELTSQQYNVLRILRGQRGEPVTLSIIQERMINKNSNASRLIDKLVNKRFVIREIDANNRRKLKISITKKGEHLLNEIDPLIDEIETETTKKLSKKEHEILNALLEKIT
jgi:DNA-binding MarR family transcriptional regulator